MTRPTSQIGSLRVGAMPRVAGTVSSEEWLRDIPTSAQDLPCDLLEIRLDAVADRRGCMERAASIERLGIPVFCTIRIKAEGGLWDEDDRQRKDLFDQALASVSGVDVELRSAIAREVAQAAQRAKKACIVSFHDFAATPSRQELLSIIREAEEFASVVKISTHVRTANDVTTLEALLEEPLRVPLCVIGMGAEGTQTRVVFPTKGSCLTYGYLDKPSAPGQLPALSLVWQLRAMVREYDEDYRMRKQIRRTA